MKRKTAIGSLRHRITVRRRSAEYDEIGEVIETFADVVTVWASVTPFRGNQKLAQQGVADASLMVTIRHLAGITTSDLIVYRGETLYIGAIIDPDPEHPGQWLEIYCAKEPFENLNQATSA